MTPARPHTRSRRPREAAQPADPPAPPARRSSVGRALPAVVAVVAVVGSGLAHRLLSVEWTDDQTAAAAARLARVPLAFGAWDGRDEPVNPREVAAADATAFLRRQYVNRVTGQAVAVLVVCGRPGPVSVHTPDVCYRGVGFEETRAPARAEVPAGRGRDPDQFLVRDFQKVGPVPVRLGIHYAWSATGAWEAPENPRLAFAHHPVLYKLYVIRELTGPGESAAAGPSMDFLRALLPELRGTLFAVP